MAVTPNKKLTRREAIKLLGAAAGAGTLANLPSKWSKPRFTGGTLPAHAQTSILYTIICDPGGDTVGPVSIPANYGGGFVATISPVQAGVVVSYSIINDAGVTFTPSVPPDSVLTDGAGQAIVPGGFYITGLPSVAQCTFTIGVRSCTQLQSFSIGPG